MELGDRLRLCRKKAGLTQHQLAAASGINRSVINNIELGNVSRSHALIKLADALGVDPMWLQTGFPSVGKKSV